MKQLRNPLHELELIRSSRCIPPRRIFTEEKARRMIKKYKKKTNRFCERAEGFYKCGKCNGVGFLKIINMNVYGYPLITFDSCNICKETGIIIWLDKMIGGWKGCIV